MKHISSQKRHHIPQTCFFAQTAEHTLYVLLLIYAIHTPTVDGERAGTKLIPVQNILRPIISPASGGRVL